MGKSELKLPKMPGQLITLTAVLCAMFIFNVSVYAVQRGNNMSSEEKGRILVGYAWGFGNIGDAAITPGLLNLLYGHFPEYRMTLVTEGSRGRVAEYLEKHFPRCEVLGGDAFRHAYNAAMTEIKEDFGGELPSINSSNIDYIFETFAQNCVDSIKRHNPEFMDVLRGTKLVIYNSGMILVYGEGSLAGTDFWGYSLRRSLPLLIAKRLGIPYGIYAHSFDSFGEPGECGFLYFSRLLEGASFVFCRDGDSLDYVKRSNIKPPVMMFVPDSTFSFRRGDYEWAEAFMAGHNLKPREFIVVIPRTISKFVDEETRKAHMKKLREIIERWVRKTGKKVVIASEGRDGLQPARELVYDKLSDDAKRHCVMMEEYWTAERASGLYRHTRILISMELHSIILAVPEGTPVILPVFKESGRKIWMLRDFKLGEYMFDIDSASTETIEQSIYQIHENYQMVSKRIQEEVIPYLRDREEEAMSAIGGILKVSSEAGK